MDNFQSDYYLSILFLITIANNGMIDRRAHFNDDRCETNDSIHLGKYKLAFVSHNHFHCFFFLMNVIINRPAAMSTHRSAASGDTGTSTRKMVAYGGGKNDDAYWIRLTLYYF